MKYFKNIEDDYIMSVSTNNGMVEISEDVYNQILLIVRTTQLPTPPEGYQYFLRNSDLSWELAELPPMPEPELSDSDILNILLGGLT